jgi:hypothetical protein
MRLLHDPVLTNGEEISFNTVGKMRESSCELVNCLEDLEEDRVKGSKASELQAELFLKFIESLLVVSDVSLPR